MPEEHPLQQLAARQLRDYRLRRPGTLFADGADLDLEQAYALQDAVSCLRLAEDDWPAGYKVGCTGPGTTMQFGMAGPVRGRVFASEIRSCGATLRFEDYANLAVEAEMALLMGGATEILAVFPVIELHNFIFRAPRKSLAELVANNGLHAGVVLPDERWLATPCDLARPAPLEIRINDTQHMAACPWALPGGVQASLNWLRGHLARYGQALAPGDIVLAGTPLGLYPVLPADRISVRLGGAVAVEATVAPPESHRHSGLGSSQ